jgi:DNA (cytosine-5)-methyltransferase 1
MVILWFNKSRRAQNVDDYETWVEGGVVPTLNAFDNGDTRATTLIAYPIQGTVIGRSDTAGPQGKGFGKENDPMFTLDSGAGANAVATTSQVRRLTPVECERLQGFPDNWTAIGSDSQRYKQMGNAVTVNVIEWIGKRLDS